MYVTTKDKDEALFIGRCLVTERLVVCVNIFDGMTSIYKWQGKLECNDEVVLIAKTDDMHVDSAIARVKQLHSYDLPCILVSPIIGGNPEYLNWLQAELS